MAIAFTTPLKSTLAIGVMAAALMVGGCGKKDKGQGALKSADARAMMLTRTDSKTFEPYFEVGTCAVDEMEALGALAGMGVGETGTNNTTFGSRSYDGGVVTYKDIKHSDDDLVMTMDTLRVHCPTLTEGGEATFARLDVEGMSLTDEEAKASVAKMSVAQVEPEVAQFFVEGLMTFDTTADWDPEEDFADIGAFSAEGVTFDMKDDGDADVSGRLEALAWGINRDSEKIDMMIDKASMKVVDNGEMGPVNFKLDNMSVVQLDMSQLNTETDPAAAISNAFKQMNLTSKAYDAILIENMDLTSDWADMTFEGMEAIAVENGNLIEMSSTTKPLKIKLKPKLGEEPEAAEIYEQLKSLDFEEMTFYGSSNSVIDKAADTVSLNNGLFVMEDGFRMNFEYKMAGLAAMSRRAEAAGDAGIEADMDTLFNGVTLNSMRFTLEDNSIVSRGMKLASEMTGQSEDALKRQLGMITMVAGMAGENEVQSKVYGESANALVAWIKDGGTMTIEMDPASPIEVAKLVKSQGEGMAADSLGFTARQDAPQ